MYRYRGMLSLVVLFISISSAAASPIDRNESRLNVYSHGFKVGEIRSSYVRGDEAGHELVTFTSHIQVRAWLVIQTYTLEGDEEARIGPQGTLSYRKVWRENGTRHQVDGQLGPGIFRCVSTSTGSDKRVVTIPRTGYDYTTMDCPELKIKGEGEHLSVRLLDLESCEVVTRSYHWIRSEPLTVNGATDVYRVIEFHDRNKAGTRWILPDDVGVRIARQDGTSAKGTYSVRAVDASP